MKSKKNRHIFSGLISVALIAVMSLGASAIQYDIPTAPMTVDNRLILCAAHAQADATPEIIGLTNTTDRAGEVPNDYNLDKAKSSVLIGTFGTDINSYPNPYLYNWAYNSFATVNGWTLAEIHTLGGISGHPNSVDAEIVEDLGTSRSLYYRPDILVGTAGSTSYADLVAALPENTDSDTTNDYNPYIVNYAMTSCTDFLTTLYDIANDCEEILQADSNRTMRYGDPIDIANQLTEYTVGLQSYILEELAANNAEKKTVAIFDPINSEYGVFFCVDAGTSTQGTMTRSRVGEFLDQTTENVVHKLGKTATSTKINNADKYFYAMSAEEIVENSDVIVTGGVNNGGNRSEDVIREMLLEYIDASNTELVNKVKTMPVMSSSFSTVGSIGANSIENLLGMAYWSSFCYPEYINPVYAATYWYYNFYHVTDINKLAMIIDSTMSTASKPDGVTTDISAYSETEFQALIDKGMLYYKQNSVTIDNPILDGMAALLQANNSAEKLSVQPTSLALIPEESFPIKAYIGSNVSDDVNWFSSNTSVATVDANGWVTAKSPGYATIIVTTRDGSQVQSCDLMVLSPIQEGWKKAGAGWWYQNADGTYPVNVWQKIDDKWYHFDKEGFMQTGWLKDNDTWYYLKSDGAMATGWLQIGPAWYYFNDNGAMVHDTWKGNYYLTSSGAMATDTWIGEYYVDSSGKWDSTKFKEGWKHDNTGWWYQYGDGTYPKSTWKQIDGKWYHFNDKGYMQTGWLQLNDTWYYLKSDGSMATGWLQVKSDWYYFNDSGAMIHDTWKGDYYLTSSGAMAVSTWIGNYYVGEDGKWVKDAVKE